MADALASLKGVRGRSARGVRGWLAQHTSEHLAKRMIELLEEVVSGGEKRLISSAIKQPLSDEK